MAVEYLEAAVPIFADLAVHEELLKPFGIDVDGGVHHIRMPGSCRPHLCRPRRARGASQTVGIDVDCGVHHIRIV